ncbi:MAG: MCE family protein [Gemmatimonadetes bacterium]|nr:MCE family protein [Gemmatimonadota bacterium]
MDLHYKQEVKVGFLVIMAVVVFVLGLTWLSGGALLGGRQMIVQVVFANVAGLSAGDPVEVSGMRVGRVSDVRLENVGRVMVTLELTTGAWRPRIDARAAVKSIDFLGSKFVDYIPGNSDQFLAEGQIITGVHQTDALENAREMADQVSLVLIELKAFLAPTVLDEVRATLQSLQGALNVVGDVGTVSLVDDASAAMGTLRNIADRVDSLLANPALERSVSGLDEVTTSLQEMAEGLAGASAALSAIMEKMNSGEGSLGLALTDSTLYWNTNDVLVSLRELLDDMRERPGRYFRLKVF